MSILRMVVLRSSNSKGSMLVDSLLGLVVLSICCLYVLPIYHVMMQQAERQRLQLHVSHVMVSAANFVKHNAQTAGEQIVDGRSFFWTYEGDELCVQYTFNHEEVETCVSKTSAASR